MNSKPTNSCQICSEASWFIFIDKKDPDLVIRRCYDHKGKDLNTSEYVKFVSSGLLDSEVQTKLKLEQSKIRIENLDVSVLTLAEVGTILFNSLDSEMEKVKSLLLKDGYSAAEDHLGTEVQGLRDDLTQLTNLFLVVKRLETDRLRAEGVSGEGKA